MQNTVGDLWALCGAFCAQCKFYSNTLSMGAAYNLLQCFRLSSHESLMPSIISFPVYMIKRCLSSCHVCLSLSDCLCSPVSLSLSHIHGTCHQGNMGRSHAILSLGFQDKDTHSLRLAHIVTSVRMLSLL